MTILDKYKKWNFIKYLYNIKLYKFVFFVIFSFKFIDNQKFFILIFMDYEEMNGTPLNNLDMSTTKNSKTKTNVLGYFYQNITPIPEFERKYFESSTSNEAKEMSYQALNSKENEFEPTNRLDSGSLTNNGIYGTTSNTFSKVNNDNTISILPIKSKLLDDHRKSNNSSSNDNSSNGTTFMLEVGSDHLTNNIIFEPSSQSVYNSNFNDTQQNVGPNMHIPDATITHGISYFYDDIESAIYSTRSDEFCNVIYILKIIFTILCAISIIITLYISFDALFIYKGPKTAIIYFTILLNFLFLVFNILLLIDNYIDNDSIVSLKDKLLIWSCLFLLILSVDKNYYYNYVFFRLGIGH